MIEPLEPSATTTRRGRRSLRLKLADHVQALGQLATAASVRAVTRIGEVGEREQHRRVADRERRPAEVDVLARLLLLDPAAGGVRGAGAQRQHRESHALASPLVSRGETYPRRSPPSAFRTMLFPTIEFAIFFPVVLGLSWLLMPRQALWKPFIVVASYVFYAAADPRFCLLLGGDHGRQPDRRPPDRRAARTRGGERGSAPSR